MLALIAPDKFKGSLTAIAVADNVAAGLTRTGVQCSTLPLADGGDGSVAAALSAGFRAHRCDVADALGRRRSTTVALRDGTAVIEIADSCGLATLPDGVLAPMTASSAGFGEAVRHAIGLGAHRIVLALGGSASTDGGTGMLAALGYEFLDATGTPLQPHAHNLEQIAHIRRENAYPGIEFVVAGDVTNPLTGPSGAAAVFGPQKGAGIADVDRIEAGLSHLVTVLERSGLPARTWARTPGAGAAGGCGFAALALGARMASGADFFLDLLDFDGHVRDADLVVTGEGRLDRQTLSGKLPAAVAARSAPSPVVAVVGRNDLASPTELFRDVYAVADIAGTDTSRDPRGTATTLRRIGAAIGHRYAPHVLSR
jgi:glycerate kinase